MALQVTKKLLSSSLDGKAYSSKSQTQLWIVIHNTGGGTASSAYNWFNNPQNGKTSAHYCVDDTQIIQCLEDSWKGHHTRGDGVLYNDKYRPAGADGVSNSNSIGIEVADWGGKYDKAKFDKAVENAIDLTISLMKKHNIDVNHVVRHGDTQNKDCPMYIMKENKWGYFKEQLANRTGGQIIENPNPSAPGSVNGTVLNGSGYVQNTNPYWHDYWNDSVDIIPNQDHRPNIANMDEVKGACLIFYPPYNACEHTKREDQFKALNWDRKYHYIIKTEKFKDSLPVILEPEKIPTNPGTDNEGDSAPGGNNTTGGGNAAAPASLIMPRAPVTGGPEDDSNSNGSTDSPNDSSTDSSSGATTSTNTEPPKEDNTISIEGGFEKIENRLLQCAGIDDNDKITYINRALFKGKPNKHLIMIACFIPSSEELTKIGLTYEDVEKNIINSTAQILWANGLSTEQLWREFDLNRAPSPLLYLERTRWLNLLKEIDKQLQWLIKCHGQVTTVYTPYVATEEPIPTIDIGVPGGSGSGSFDSYGSGTGNVPDIGGISDTAKAVWTFFTGRGFTKECTAGIMGNLQQESGMNPTRQQSGGGPGRGICQWTVSEGRFKSLKAHAASKGKEWTDLQSQLEWLDMELQGRDATTLNYLKKYVGGYEQFKQINDINKACKVFEDSFERAGKPMMEKRYAYAKQFYDKFAGTTTANYVQARTPSNDPGGSSGSSSGSSGNRLVWPCPGHNVGSSAGSKFGMRLHPIKKVMKMHNGIDIPAPGGTPIVAAADGKVITNAFQAGGAGNYIKIDHGGGLTTVYMHMQSKSPLAVGTQVTAGQTVGPVGTTGGSTGNHLHFEVRVNGEAQDPLNYTSLGSTSSNLTGSALDGSSASNIGSVGLITNVNSLVESIAGNIINPGPAGAYEGSLNSMGGVEHNDWGGKTNYRIKSSGNPGTAKPEMKTIVTNKDYKDFCDAYFSGYTLDENGKIVTVYNYQNYWDLVDVYVSEHEPYDKGLVDAVYNTILPNDRLETLTKNFTTVNENIFNYNVLESGPGTAYHCVKAASELNIIATPLDLTVEPIYPDLVIPPSYNTSDYNEVSPNTLPIQLLEDAFTDPEAITKQFEYDYDLLEEVKKESAKTSGPINSLDPYPFDKKIEELEMHYPKVMIDEIESQLYTDNHPGSPISQPVAKNFAMIQDAMMSQSKKMEQRLVRLENLLATVIRNQGRMGARMNINCVYYGGQSTYAGKYKCIRCLHDDRINDESVTIDQCLNCTRYEPILGQIYEILNESGMNGSAILDDMQMSYSTLNDFKKINSITERSPKYDFVSAEAEDVGFKPSMTRIEIWKQGHQDRYIERNPGANIEQIPETDYIFRMDWNNTFLNSQEPDVKDYPAEGIIARYKKETGDIDYDDYIKSLDPKLDKDIIEDVQKEKLIANSEWVDTREQADSTQTNKYSSENFFFYDFGVLTGVTAGSGSVPGDMGIGGGASIGGTIGSGSALRSKICEMAATIVQECQSGQAWYNQIPRTVDYTKPAYTTRNGKKVKAYDCTSFVSCCYTAAGLKSMYSKTCSGGTLIQEIVNNGGDMWLCNELGLSKALPGDVLIRANSKVNESNMGKMIATQHAMIYIGDGKISHAANSKTGIKTEVLKDTYRWTDGHHFFVRPKDLKEADAREGSSSSTDTSTTPSTPSTEA